MNMRKIVLKLGALVMVLMAMMAFTACDKDDDKDCDIVPPTNLNNQITGAWYDSEEEFGVRTTYIITFNTDKAFKIYENGALTVSGTYSISNNKVNLTGNKVADNTVYGDQFTVISITNQEMTVIDSLGREEDLDRISNDGNYVP